MKKLKILCCLILSVIASTTYAQSCGALTINSQADVDNFVAANAGTCTEIQGMYINFDADLTGLTFITKIGFIIVDMGVTIPSFQGLNNVTNIGEINIRNATVLSFDALQNVTYLYNLTLFYSSNVSSFAGLDNVVTIANKLEIRSQAPNNFQGLGNVTNIGLIEINDNSLNSFTGLNSLTSIGEIKINNTAAIPNFIGLESVTSLTSLIVNGGGVTSLQGLENVTSSLNVLSLTNLAVSTLDPIQNAILETSDRIYIKNCQVQEINGLSNLQYVLSNLTIENNPNLLEINGLGNLQTVTSYISIQNNSSLQHLDGLSNLKSPGGALVIKNNDALTSVDGLNNIEYVSGNSFYGNSALRVTNNDSLDDCCPLIPFMNGYIPVETVEINNIGNCFNTTYVYAACNSIVDTDGDGVNDDVDSCVLTSNSTQSDVDNDGQGDACDDDIDGDGIENLQDNCPDIANNNQADSDSDGIGDSCATQSGVGTGSFGVGTNMPSSKFQVTEGDVYIDNTYRGIIMRTTDGRCFRYRPDKTGTLVGKEIVCPN